jgi:hypothetical protein
MGRNTPLLREIIEVLQLPHDALAHLERHFNHRLIVDAGNTSTIEAHAKTLRLRVAPDERQAVLDYIASKGMVGINIDVVEDAVNSLLGEDRFIEPES